MITSWILAVWSKSGRLHCPSQAVPCAEKQRRSVVWAWKGFSDLWCSASSGLFLGLLVFFLSLMSLWVWTASSRAIFVGRSYYLLIHTECFILATSWSTYNEERNTHYLSSRLAELHGWRQMQISGDAAAIVVGIFFQSIFEWDLGDECNLSLVLFLVISLFWLKYFIPFYCQDLLPELLWNAANSSPPVPSS